jgi:phage virion morphogenesis protein
MINLEINDGGLLAAMARLEAGVTDMTPGMLRVADVLRDGAEDRGQRGVDPDGNAWAPRSPVTLARYLAGNGNGSFGGVLYKTGEMLTTLGTDYGPDFASVGSNAIQSAVMQFGAAQGAFGRTSRNGPIPWGNIPARPFLGLSDDDRQGIILTIDEYLDMLAGDGTAT